MSLTSQERQRRVREGKVLTLARPRGPPSPSHLVPAAAQSAPRIKGWEGPEVAQPSALTLLDPWFRGRRCICI